jgi:hypothetical protein
MKRETRLQVAERECERLQKALADILAVCERPVIGSWPGALGEVQALARMALQEDRASVLRVG